MHGLHGLMLHNGGYGQCDLAISTDKKTSFYKFNQVDLTKQYPIILPPTTKSCLKGCQSKRWSLFHLYLQIEPKCQNHETVPLNWKIYWDGWVEKSTNTSIHMEPGGIN